MPVRVLPDFLINQIAAGEVVERPASVVKELVENALDAGADQIMIDVADGGRTMISVIDNGSGMQCDDLKHCILRHATSKLPDDDLLNINFMGFRGEALPSIASVSDMTIDTACVGAENGWQLDANTGDIRPSDWECGTRIRVKNLFGRTPARLKFLRGDRAEMMGVLDVVKRLAMARSDVGFTLNNKWRFPKNQDIIERITTVMGEDVRGKMLEINTDSSTVDGMRLSGFISVPTLRRASSIDQYLFVNGRPVRDKVLIGALRAAYMDVMHAREFPLCALYLTVPSRSVDVNVSPAKTDVHFLEPTHVRSFIIKSLRDALARTMVDNVENKTNIFFTPQIKEFKNNSLPKNAFIFEPVLHICEPINESIKNDDCKENLNAVFFADTISQKISDTAENAVYNEFPLGRIIGQIGNKYILAATADCLVVVDQHAAHERITYERLRNRTIKGQPLLTPIVISMRAEDVMAVLSVADEMRMAGLHIEAFGDDAIAIFEKPADWDLNWSDLFGSIAAEVREYGHSSQLGERLHLKLANYACHHSVRAGQRLDVNQMDALLRDIERTTRGGQCNHGRPVYKFIPLAEMDSWFERI
ncbi:MAG: DNA mismatch repair endonuclease MutL [Alphaproteobacteria bacterium]|nr:DNA mismatch repair endonuclease MutL [Alphaproteobacteria bacterium]